MTSSPSTEQGQGVEGTQTGAVITSHVLGHAARPVDPRAVFLYQPPILAN